VPAYVSNDDVTGSTRYFVCDLSHAGKEFFHAVYSQIRRGNAQPYLLRFVPVLWLGLVLAVMALRLLSRKQRLTKTALSSCRIIR